jgi:uncharacterized membrane protein
MERVRNLLALLRGQLWVLPALMSMTGLVLAYVLLLTPYPWSQSSDSKLWWLYSGDANSARDLLGAMLSGIITMTSLVVSLTFLTLTLAANQLGPRLIQNFIGDRQIQSVLGLFLATVLYILFVLRSLGDSLGEGGVPHFAVTVASVLTILSLFALLFYVHKIAHSIVADTVVERVSHQLLDSIEAMLEPKAESQPQLYVTDLPPLRRSLNIGRAGYIQTIDYGALVKCAEKNGLVLDIKVRAGHFVLIHGDHVDVLTNQDVSDRAIDAIRGAFIVNAARSPAQDLEFSIRQLVEIALRALSPGINDPFTALAVIDRLCAALERIDSRELQPKLLCDESSHLRVVANRSDFSGLIDACFEQIRQAACDHPAVLIHLAEMLGQLAPLKGGQNARGAVLAHLDRLQELADKAGSGTSERGVLAARIQRARQLLLQTSEASATS